MTNKEEHLYGLEKNREDFNVFISSLRGPSYRKKIVTQYPDAVLCMPPPKVLPEFGTEKVWSCDCGCGEVVPVLVPFPVSSRVGMTGLLEATVEGIWVSPCVEKGSEPERGLRHHSAVLWDNLTDSEHSPLLRLEFING